MTTLGSDVLVQEVMAAITTAPCFNSTFSPLRVMVNAVCQFIFIQSETAHGGSAGVVKDFLNSTWAVDNVKVSCGRFGPDRVGFDLAQVHASNTCVNSGVRSSIAGAEQSLGFEIGLDQVDTALRPTAGAAAGNPEFVRPPGSRSWWHRIQATYWRSWRAFQRADWRSHLQKVPQICRPRRSRAGGW